MNRYRCTIHNVTFDLKAEPDSSDALKMEFQLCECPICKREESQKLRDKYDRIEMQRDALLKAIEIKQEFLVTKKGIEA